MFCIVLFYFILFYRVYILCYIFSLFILLRMFLFLKSLRGSTLAHTSDFDLVSERPSPFRPIRRDLEDDSMVSVDLIVIRERLTQFLLIIL